MKDRMLFWFNCHEKSFFIKEEINGGLLTIAKSKIYFQKDGKVISTDAERGICLKTFSSKVKYVLGVKDE